MKDIQYKINHTNEKIKEVQDQAANKEKLRKAKQDEFNAYKKTVEDKWNNYFRQPLDQNRGSNLGKVDGRIKYFISKMHSNSTTEP